MTETDLVKLFALDEEDLAVVSAHVQDAVLKVGDILWLSSERRVVLPINRFTWERARARRRSKDERRRAVLQFDRVERFRASGVDAGQKDAVLAILALTFEPTDPPAGLVTVVCAGEAALRLEVECLEVRLTDLGASWSAGMRPKHSGAV